MKRFTQIAAVALALTLAACSGAQPGGDLSPPLESTDGADASVSPPSRPAVGADASVADATSEMPVVRRDSGVPAGSGTQVLCYGVGVTDAGTSLPAACADDGGTCDPASMPGCNLLVDPAHANPTVWCCP